MPVTTERLPRSQIALKIEVEDDRIEASMGKAVQNVAKQVRIPGFRPGKAPRAVVERTVGRTALLQEALDIVLPQIYNETIEAQAIDAIGQPSFELQSMEPVVVNARVPVRPTVELKDYTALRAPRATVSVTDEAVDEQVDGAIESARRRYATLEPVERAIAWGDTVRADVTVSVEGQGEPHVEQDAEFRVTQGGVVSLPGFLDHLIGLERGGPYALSLTLPADFEAQELAGKTAIYQVTVHEVKQEVLPALDDDFARSLDEEGVDSVATLRERLRKTAQEQLEQNASLVYQDEVLDLLLAGADIDYPEILVEREIDRLVDHQSNHAAHTRQELDQWLQRVGKSEQEVRDGLRDSADLNVRRALVLAEFVKREAITISEQEIDDEIDATLQRSFAGLNDGDQRQRLRGLFDTPDGRASTRSQLQTHRALARLAEICAQGDQGDGVGEGAAPPRARGTRRRRSARSTEGGGAASEASPAVGDDTEGEETAD